MKVKKTHWENNNIVFEFEHGRYGFFMHIGGNELNEPESLKNWLNTVLTECEKRCK